MQKIKRTFTGTVKIVILCGVTLAVSLLLAETFLRVLTPSHYGTPPGMFEGNTEVDFIPTPNFEGYFFNREHKDGKIHISINEDGFRDDEYPIQKDKNVYRIITLGDSFTMAEQVQHDETYSEVLESLLNQESEEMMYEVFNLGVSGYGTKQAFAFLKMKGEKYKPDMVIYAYTTNDLTDNLVQKYTVRYGERLDASYENETSALIHMKIFMYRNSALARAVYRVMTKKENIKEKTVSSLFTKYGGEHAWEELRRVLSEMKDYADARGISFVVLYNTPFQREKDYLDASLFDRSRISNLTNELGIFLIDPTDEILAYGGEQLYFEHDGHWTPEGHRFIAELIQKRIVFPKGVS